jgi:hypothetical protein
MFLLRQELWERLGMRPEDPAWLSLPEREVEDYLLYIQLIRREEQARERKNSAAQRRR